jgi:hypothetical protein
VFAAAALGLTATDCSAADRWTDVRQVGPFHCRAAFSLDAFGPLLADLEHLQAELVRTLAIAPADHPVDVYLFEDRSSYRAFVRRRLPHVPYRRALFVKTGARCEVFVYRHDQFQTDLRHECTHALLHSALAMVPLWLDEGLAEYFEVPSGQRAHGHPHLAQLKWNMRLGIIPPLENLEGKERVEEMGVLEYRFSWAWVHFMFHGPGRVHRELVAYLADIRAGAFPGRLSRRLAVTSADVERQMIDHFKHWRRAASTRTHPPTRGAGTLLHGVWALRKCPRQYLRSSW